MVEGVSIAEEGMFRFEARLGGALFHSNPVCCQRRPERRIYWGDPHVHTVLSNCHAVRCRSLNFCFAAARYLTGLDWVSAADHVSNGRCELARWKEQTAGCEAHDDPPDFVTLPAYEASLRGGCGGDTNPYFRRAPGMFVDEYEEGDVKTLCAKLAETVDPADFFVVPHHTTRTGKHGEIPDAIYPGPELMPVVEICPSSRSTRSGAPASTAATPIRSTTFTPARATSSISSTAACASASSAAPTPTPPCRAAAAWSPTLTTACPA